MQQDRAYQASPGEAGDRIRLRRRLTWFGVERLDAYRFAIRRRFESLLGVSGVSAREDGLSRPNDRPVKRAIGFEPTTSSLGSGDTATLTIFLVDPYRVRSLWVTNSVPTFTLQTTTGWSFR